MPAYVSTEQLHKVMTALWQRIKADQGMSDALLKAKMAVRFHYREPLGTITIDTADGKQINIYAGQCDLKPLVEMFMTADVAHEFWLGKVSVPMAILTGRMVAKGPVDKALALLPTIKPAFKIYPEIYQSTGKAVSV